jgi:2-dehydro-3-deoxygluconokinase
VLGAQAPLDARGSTTGAFCVGMRGDWEALPTREGLELLSHSEGTALR